MYIEKTMTETLINEMRELKTKEPQLSLAEILRIMNIQAMRDLTKMIWRVGNNG